MKALGIFLFSFFLYFSPLNAQTNPLPFWDYRSFNTVQATIGLGYYFGAQNHNFSGFLRVDYSFYKDIYKEIFLDDPTTRYFNSQFNAQVGFTAKVQRNIKLYDVVTRKARPDVNSWTYLVDMNFRLEYLLRKINASYFKTPGQDLEGTVLGLEYSLLNNSNTSIFKYLGNTNGRGSFIVRQLTDRWGGRIYLQNDFWILSMFKDHIRNHDHGNTTEAGLSFYYRYNLQESSDENISYYNNEKITFDYWFQIITDRKTANNTSSAFARLGYYSVRNDSIFHGYSRYALGVSGDFYKIRIGFLKDNLLLGRNLQRWAHQGTNHRNLKNRKNIGWPFPKKSIYRSKFEFTSKSVRSKKIFLQQLYFEGKYIDAIDREGNINMLTNAETKNIYKKYPELQKKFKMQRFVNKYRYKKSRIMEPTALFPWEGRENYFEKPRKNVFLDLNIFKQS